MTDPVLHRASTVVPGGVLAFTPVRDARVDGASDVYRDLDPAELELAMQMSSVRRGPFVAGRQALRAALRSLDPGLAAAPLLRTARGAPSVPAGATGSISHKRTRAVALAAPQGDPANETFVGVDLESRPQQGDALRDIDQKRGLAARILTAREFDGIAALDAAAHREATLLHFAIKEAVYKTIDPFVGRYVRFTEVELALLGDTSHGGAQHGIPQHGIAQYGIALVTLRLPECAQRAMHVEAAWSLEPEWIVATAISVSPRAAQSPRPGSASPG
ncbi:MAG: 4'-phosphopantetheinyl transferase superfamily protein [Gemmatimonadota bacterium]